MTDSIYDSNDLCCVANDKIYVKLIKRIIFVQVKSSILTLHLQSTALFGEDKEIKIPQLRKSKKKRQFKISYIRGGVHLLMLYLLAC